MLKLDLTLLKKFVSELEVCQLDAESKYIEEGEGVQYEYLTGISKSAGLLLAVIQESNLLIGDIQRLVKSESVPQDALKTLLQSLHPEDTKGRGPGFGGSGFGGNFN